VLGNYNLAMIRHDFSKDLQSNTSSQSQKRTCSFCLQSMGLVQCSSCLGGVQS
jgi:hypothetical protein